VLVAIRESQVSGLDLFLKLVPPRQSFDEGLLGQILRVMHIAHNPINLPTNAPQLFVEEAAL
jgi:hypothetical protein